MIPEIKIVPEEESKKDDPLVKLLGDVKVQMQKAVLKEIGSLLKEATPEQIAVDTVDSFLEEMRNSAKKIMLSMMGFNKRWSSGNWEIDYCNGRDGNSAIGEVTRDIFTKQARIFVEEHQDEIFSLTEKEHKQIIASMRSAFHDRIKWSAKKYAEEAAQKYLKDQADALKEELNKFDIFEVAKRLAEVNAKSEK